MARPRTIIAALVSEEGLERGDPHRLRLRGAATHRAEPGEGEREVERDCRHPRAARHDVDRGRGRDDRRDGMSARHRRENYREKGRLHSRAEGQTVYPGSVPNTASK